MTPSATAAKGKIVADVHSLDETCMCFMAVVYF